MIVKSDDQNKGIFSVYAKLPIFLSWWIVLLNGIFLWIEWRVALVFLFLSIIVLIGSVVWYRHHRAIFNQSVIKYAVDFSHLQKEMFFEMKLPYAILNREGKFLWKNQEFSFLLEQSDQEVEFLTDLFPEVSIQKVKPDEEVLFFAQQDDKHYRLYAREMNISDEQNIYVQNLGESVQDFIGLRVFDETEILLYKQKIKDQELVAGLLYLDNYEEVLDNTDEVRHSLLMALIDRKINRYISLVSGIVKKMEKDKYFIVIEQKYIKQIQEDHFSLLEEVKAINVSKGMAFTISIALGMNGGSYPQNYRYARAAMEMALARGGDQAIIKDGGNILYYGGKSRTTEKMTRVKARVKAYALKELMDTKDRVIIMGHKIGDIDALGASVGIWRIAISLNKKAHIVFDDTTSAARPVLETFLQGDYPEDMFISGTRAKELVDQNTMLTVLDVNKPSYAEVPELLEKVKTVVVLDHHRQSSETINYAALSYIEPYASSTCEMVAEIFQYILDGIRMKPAEADAMYAGIVVDTDNFVSKTGVRTFEAAAFLRRNGADVVRVRKMFREKMDNYKAKMNAVNNAEIFKKVFAISISIGDGLDSPTVVGAQAANELLDIVGIKASFVLTKYRNMIYISARSIDEVNVQIIMERLGGGGHLSTAGAQIPNSTIEEAREKLKSILSEMIEEGIL
ncbi:delta-lactam-biosynthetic de-N-acetylase [Clostridia bacterium]|nr:delta-lactam-biosynthetic de-N-acetylase [Clostridia bacterium]